MAETLSTTAVSETAAQLVQRLAATHPSLTLGLIQGILDDEHAMLTALGSDDVPQAIVVDALLERLEMLDAR
jgi:hypothetical protein